jgi:hypothetical protein
MSSEKEKLEQLKRDLLALFDDLSNEQLINVTKLENVSPGSYPYGEGMHDGLHYAVAGLKNVLSRHEMLSLEPAGK